MCEGSHIQLSCVFVGTSSLEIGWEEEPRDAVVARGSQLSWPCKATADRDVHFSYSWFKDGSAVVNRSATTVLPDGTLRIRRVRSSDEGVYSCLATSAFGSLISKPASLQIACKLSSPRFTSIHPSPTTHLGCLGRHQKQVIKLKPV